MLAGLKKLADIPRPVRLGSILFTLMVVAAVFAFAAQPAGAINTQVGGPFYYDTLPAADGTEPYSVGAKWDKTTLTYSIRNCPNTLDCSVAIQATREGVEAWDAVSGIILNEVTGDADINIWWYSGNHGDGNPFDGPGNVLAHAFFPISWLGSIAGDAHFDNGETWIYWAPTQPWEIHLPTVVSHEIGHSLGLEHSGDSSALMWAQYVGVRGLGPDDIAGIQSLYGPNTDETGGGGGGTSTPPGGELQPSGVNATATTSLKIRSGPSTSNGQIGLFPYNAVAPIYGKNVAGDWYYIQYGGTRGWVAAWYTRLDGPASQIPVVGDTPGGTPPTPNPELPPTGVTATTTSPTRMRTGPGTNYASITTIPWGDSVPVFAKNAAGNWLYVEWGGKRGWIAAWLVKIDGDLSNVPVQ